MTIGPSDDPPLVGMVAAFDGTTVTLAAGAAIDSAGAGDALMFSAYSEPRPSSLLPIDRLPNAWSLDNFGQILLAMTSPDGRLLEWDPSGGGTGVAPAAMTEVTSDDTGTGVAPHGRLFVVTQERFVVIFGMVDDGTLGQGSFRRFGWCDQENYHAWNFSNVTQPGWLPRHRAGEPDRCGACHQERNGFLDRSQSLPLEFLRHPLRLQLRRTRQQLYAVVAREHHRRLVDGALDVAAGAVFIRRHFDRCRSLARCEPGSTTTSTSSTCASRRARCMSAISMRFWWFFPQLGQPYNTRCIIYYYKEGWWSQGRMCRSAGITASFTAQTIMADGAGRVRARARQFLRRRATAVGRDVRPQPDQRRAADHRQADDARRRGRRIDNLLYSLFYRNSRSTGAPELQTTPRPVRDGRLCRLPDHGARHPA